MRDAVVIGAGAAGLAAATALRPAGRSVTILEARDRLGGRAWTSYDVAPHPVELGAEYVHGENVITWRYLERYGLTTNDQTTVLSIMGFDGRRTLAYDEFLPSTALRMGLCSHLA